MILLMKCESGCTCKRHQNSVNFKGKSSNPCKPGCTCRRHKPRHEMAPGEQFGRWTVIETGLWLEYSAERKRAVKVRCTCGVERTLTAATLTRGTTTSCGCLRREKLLAAATHHGLRKHPLYAKWKSMIQRCENPEWPQFKDWGGRGIAVCESWHDVQTFITWIEQNLGPCPKGKSLDRIDNDGNYEPGNVRWATRSEQMRNRRPRAKRGSP